MHQDTSNGRESLPVGRPDFKPGVGHLMALCGFDSHSLPPPAMLAPLLYMWSQPLFIGAPLTAHHVLVYEPESLHDADKPQDIPIRRSRVP